MFSTKQRLSVPVTVSKYSTCIKDEEEGLENLHDLLKVTELAIGATIQIHAPCFQIPCLEYYFIFCLCCTASRLHAQ